jgi:hypothetical protein
MRRTAPRSEFIGQGLVRSRAITARQVDAILTIQRRDDDRLFGEIAVDLGYTDDRTISEYLESRRKIGVLV